MDDRDIIALYWQRMEAAIHETATKYGGLCYTIAHNILFSREDSEECVNDTYLGLWNAIPPHRPNPLLASYRVFKNFLFWHKKAAASRTGQICPRNPA